jgi:hypothetical protein
MHASTVDHGRIWPATQGNWILGVKVEDKKALLKVNV